MSGNRFLRVVGGMSLAWVTAGSVVCYAADTLPTNSASAGLYVKVQLDNPLKMSKLKAGDIVQGRLLRDVYSVEHEVFPEDSSVRLTVDHMEKRHRAVDDHWPWVVKVFTPRHERYPVFRTAVVSGASGESALNVSLVSINRRREVHAQSKKKQAGQHSGEAGLIEVNQAGNAHGPKPSMAPIMVLEAFRAGSETASDDKTGGASTGGFDLSALGTLPTGTAFKVLLLGDVSASKSRAGDMVQARLLEPVFLNSRLALPAGVLFQGKVVKQIAPRWGSRAGSLSLTFTGVTLPGGNFVPLAASLAGAELDRGSHTRIDAEGQLRGEGAGRAWMAINIGMTAGLAKGVDDGTQLIVEALISTATDASTAGAARIVSSCISGIYMVTRHGRDVVLPRFTELDIALDRPMSVTKNAESASPAALEHGN